MEDAWPTQYVCIGEDTYCRRARHTLIQAWYITRQWANLHLLGTRQDRLYLLCAQRASASTHCIIYREPRRHAPSRRVDVEVDGPRGVLGLEEEQLRDRHRRRRLADLY